MNWINDMKIGKRLVLVFGIIIIFVAGLGIYSCISMGSLNNATEEISDKWLASVNDANAISALTSDLKIHELEHVILKDEAESTKLETKMDNTSKEIDDLIEKYESSPYISEEEKKLINSVKSEWAMYMEVHNQAMAYSNQNKDEDALKLLSGKGQIAFDNFSDKLVELSNYNKSGSDKAAKESKDLYNVSIVILISAILIIIALAIILGIIIFRSIVYPINKLKLTADAIAAGDMSFKGDSVSKDEIGELMISFGQMSENIKSLISEMDHMSKEHDAGDIDVFVQEDKFKGAYREMAHGVNEMVKGHVSVKKKAMACIAEFGKGNFDAELEKFPGKKAFINDSIEAMRKNLREVNSEINKLIVAANEGNLNERANSHKFQGDFAKIINGLNGLLDAILAPLNEAMQVMMKISVNDYTSEITGKYNGQFKEFGDSINSARTRMLSVQDALERLGRGDTSRLEELEKIGKRSENDRMMPACRMALRSIRELINEAGTLANAAINGDLNVRVNENKFEGGYREIIAGMNKTMEAFAKPIQEASAVMLKLAEGNLTVTMDGDYKGEYAQIKHDLNLIISSFSDVLNEINGAAMQVASGSKQVSDSALALSQGSTEQASAVEELTASLEEISSQTKQNAEKATQASGMAENSKENARLGDTQMKELLKAMDEINVSSANISRIIKVIDDIAFQTNILALNAAVEAARAGQHGKGFAVVAEEVRNLAARSADAAKETTSMIEGSIRKVEGGTKLANETAQALNRIVENVEKVTDVLSEIAIASNEQAIGIEQINQGIVQVSQVVQSNSATSQESAAASEELSGQAELLKQMVNKFKLNKEGTTSNNNEINPDVLRIMENMSSRKTGNGGNNESKRRNSGKSKITLSDTDFGKY